MIPKPAAGPKGKPAYSFPVLPEPPRLRKQPASLPCAFPIPGAWLSDALAGAPVPPRTASSWQCAKAGRSFMPSLLPRQTVWVPDACAFVFCRHPAACSCCRPSSRSPTRPPPASGTSGATDRPPVMVLHLASADPPLRVGASWLKAGSTRPTCWGTQDNSAPGSRAASWYPAGSTRCEGRS